MRKLFPPVLLSPVLLSPVLLSLGTILSISDTLGSGREGEERLSPENFPSAVMAPFIPRSPVVIDLKWHLPEAFFDALEKYPHTPYPRPFSDIPVPVLPKEKYVNVDPVTLERLNAVHAFWEKYRDISAQHLRLTYEFAKKQEACPPAVGFMDELGEFQIMDELKQGDPKEEEKDQPGEGEKEKKEEQLKEPEKEDEKKGEEDDTEHSIPARSLSSSLWGVAGTIWSAGGYVVTETSTAISERLERREMEKAQRERDLAKKALKEATEALRKIDEAYVNIQKEAQRRYPRLSLDEIEARAYQSATLKKPEAYYPLYASSQSPSFYPPKPVVAFQLDRQDFEIALVRLPLVIERLEQENKALEALLGTYRKYFGAQGGSFDGDSLKRQLEAKLARKFLFVSPSGLEGKQKDDLRKRIQDRIARLPEEALQEEEEGQLDGKYGALPKYSDEREGKQEEKSGEAPFEKIYAEPGSKESYECLKPHRRVWFHVLNELHKERQPVQAGYGEGLARPNEPGAMDDPEELWMPLEKRQQFIGQFRKWEVLREKNRNLFRELFERPHAKAPYPADFYSLTRPELPKPVKRADIRSSAISSSMEKE